MTGEADRGRADGTSDLGPAPAAVPPAGQAADGANAPANAEAGPSGGGRDAYGFEVHPEYHDLYATYAPIYEATEAERVHQWSSYLLELMQEHSTSGFHFKDITSFADEALLHELLDPVRRQAQRASGTAGGGTREAERLRELAQGGIPLPLRGKVWKVCLDIRRRQIPGYYQQLVESALGHLKSKKKLDYDDVAMASSPDSTASGSEGTPAPRQSGGGAAPPGSPAAAAAAPLPQQPSSVTPPPKSLQRSWLVQIEKDLHRTFPRHHLMDRSGRLALRRTLAAYALHNPEVGYCQGMNFVAGLLLMFMDEEDAFYCLSVIVEDILPGYFSQVRISTYTSMHTAEDGVGGVGWRVDCGEVGKTCNLEMWVGWCMWGGCGGCLRGR